MRLHELVKMLRPGQRLRISELSAAEHLAPEEMLPGGNKKPQEGPQEHGMRRWWTPPLTDAQMLAYWNRIVLKYERPRGGKEVFAIVTQTDGMIWKDGRYVDIYHAEGEKKEDAV